MSQPPIQNSAVQEHYSKKVQYMQQLKTAFLKNLQLKNGHSFGVYEKVRDVIPAHCRKDKYEPAIQQLIKSGEPFQDPAFVPDEANIACIKTDQMKYAAWYRINEFYDQKEYTIFQKFKIKD